jgi:RNA polymerase sigma factor (sigma-70 family)
MQAMQLTAEESTSVRDTMQRVHRGVARFSRNDSQDIVQEAMARAVRTGVGCDAEPWLKVVARRIATDNARRRREIAIGPEALERVTHARAASPEDIVVARDSAGLINRALQSLPTRYRDALVTYASEQDHTAVARAFGISPNATWSLLCRARARLRQELDRVGYAFGVTAVRVQRWIGDVSTAAAVTCVAVGSTLIGPVAHSAPAAPVVKRSSAVVSVELPRVVPETARTAVSVEPGPAKKVVERVEAVVERTEIATYAVQPCGLGGAPLPLGARVTVLEDTRRSLVGQVLTQLPEPLREIEALTCAR